MNIENSTNQLQHPYYGMGAAHKLTVSLQNPNNLVLIEPSSVHNTHTHFYQTNYRRGPFETRVCFYAPPRVPATCCWCTSSQQQSIRIRNFK